MLKNFYVIIGALISSSIYLISITLDLDLFEVVLNLLINLEHFEIDEFIIPGIVFFLFLTLNQTKKNKINAIDFEKEKIFKATLSSSKHIINNFLNQMNLFKMTAEETNDFPSEILSLYDEVIKETSELLDSLSNVTDIRETTILYSVSPNKFAKVKND